MLLEELTKRRPNVKSQEDALGKFVRGYAVGCVGRSFRKTYERVWRMLLGWINRIKGVLIR